MKRKVNTPYGVSVGYLSNSYQFTPALIACRNFNADP